MSDGTPTLSDHDAMLVAARDGTDATSRGAFADLLDEQGRQGAAAVRRSAELERRSGRRPAPGGRPVATFQFVPPNGRAGRHHIVVHRSGNGYLATVYHVPDDREIVRTNFRYTLPVNTKQDVQLLQSSYPEMADQLQQFHTDLPDANPPPPTPGPDDIDHNARVKPEAPGVRPKPFSDDAQYSAPVLLAAYARLRAEGDETGCAKVRALMASAEPDAPKEFADPPVRGAGSPPAEPPLDNVAHERAQFEKAIDANPTDSLNHLAYADWLRDHGEHEEGDFRQAMGEWWQNRAQKGERIHFPPDEIHKDLPMRQPIWRVHLRKIGAPGIPDEDANYVVPGVPTSGIWDKARSPEVGQLNPGQGWVAWHNYRDMEEAFRQGFRKRKEWASRDQS